MYSSRFITFDSLHLRRCIFIPSADVSVESSMTGCDQCSIYNRPVPLQTNSIRLCRHRIELCRRYDNLWMEMVTALDGDGEYLRV